MGNTRPESSLAVLPGDMRGGTSGSIYRGQRTGEEMGGKKQTQPQARRDSDGTLRGSVHGNQGSSESATDSASSTTTTQDVYQSIRPTVPSNAAMIPPPPTDMVTSVPIKQEETTVTMTSAELPLMRNIFDGYFSNRVDVRLDTQQTKTLRALLFGLQSRFARLQNGKEVTNGQDAIKWILENIE